MNFLSLSMPKCSLTLPWEERKGSRIRGMNSETWVWHCCRMVALFSQPEQLLWAPLEGGACCTWYYECEMVIWVYRQPQLKPLWLLWVPGCHLLCSQHGGTGLEVTPQLQQHSQSRLACFSCRYFWINFGLMWAIQLFFFVLCYLVFLQLSSLFLLRCVFPAKLFYPDIRNYTAHPTCVSLLL